MLALELGGPIDAARAALRLGSDPSALDGRIADLDEAGLVESVRAQGVRLVLTAEGKVRARALVQQERVALRRDLEALYDTFARLNREMKEILLRWQTRSVGGERLRNDHADAVYDDRVLHELGRWYARACPLIDRLARLRPRYGRYRERLAHAVERAGRGEREYVSGLGVESLHVVWWGLHADLLAVLGRAREADDA